MVIHLNTYPLLSLIWRHIGYLVRWMSYWISNSVPVHLSFIHYQITTTGACLVGWGWMGRHGGHLGWRHFRSAVPPHHLPFTIEHITMHCNLLGWLITHLNTLSLLSLTWLLWAPYWIFVAMVVILDHHLIFLSSMNNFEQQGGWFGPWGRKGVGWRPSWMTSLPVRHLGWRHIRSAILDFRSRDRK